MAITLKKINSLLTICGRHEFAAGKERNRDNVAKRRERGMKDRRETQEGDGDKQKRSNAEADQ